MGDERLGGIFQRGPRGNEVITPDNRSDGSMVKTMTCRQLGGACDAVFRAQSFEDMAKLSKQHGMEWAHPEEERAP